jgi:hypothetical protein
MVRRSTDNLDDFGYAKEPLVLHAIVLQVHKPRQEASRQYTQSYGNNAVQLLGK